MKTFKFNCRERIRQCIRKIKYRARRCLTLFSCNKLMFSCKNEAKVANYCNYKLSRDIERNPGPPTYVGPNKTIVAPYSQGNELLFGQNAGQLCVATSFCSLICNSTRRMSSANDPIKITNIGNQLYNNTYNTNIISLLIVIYYL